MTATNRPLPANYTIAPVEGRRWLGLSRAECLTALFLLTIANALLPNMLHGLLTKNLLYTVVSLFEISVIVWAAIFIAAQLALEEQRGEISVFEKVASVTIVAASMLPIGPISWILVTLMALYLIVRELGQSAIRRAAWIFLALAFPMFWSKRLFNIMAEYFLSLDAILVSSITHTQRISNLVKMPEGDGFLEIAPRCSSMANVSLAVLCWVLFTQTRRTVWRPANILWCSAACLIVVTINVTRISLIGFFPSYYDLLHGDVGSMVTNWLTVIAVFAVCNYGARRAPLNSL